MAEQQHPPDEGRGPVEQPAAVFPPDHPTPNPEVGHEHGDVNVWAILYFAGGLVLLALVIHFGVGWMYSAFERSEARAKRSQFPLAEEKKRQRGGEDAEPAEPQLEATWGTSTAAFLASGEDAEPAEPQLEGVKYRRGKRAGVSTEDELTRYGWGTIPGLGARTVGLPGSPLGPGPLLAASALVPGSAVVSVPVEKAFDRLLADKKLKVRAEQETKKWRDRGLGTPPESASGRWPQEGGR
jgi:hypothetical protein